MKKICAVLSLIFCAATCFAEPVFVAGKDYVVLDSNAAREMPRKSGALTVKEFFSYGCPWCFKLEKSLNKWKEKLPRQVTFQRVPVVFEAGWDVYAKAYYAADLLGVERKLSLAIFEQVQDKEKKLDSNEAMVKFFIDHGIAENMAQSAFLSSPTIDAKVLEGIQQMQALQVNSVPSFVINDHYKVDIGMMEGDSDKLFRVVGFLVAKELVLEMQK